MNAACTHPASHQRSISDYEVRIGRRTFVKEEVVCEACGARRRIRTAIVDDQPQSGIYRKCPDCGVRVFTSASDGALGLHDCDTAYEPPQ